MIFFIRQIFGRASFGTCRPLALKCAFLSGDLRKPELLLEHLLHVTDFTLYLPACFFRCPAIAQVWIPCRLAGLFFHFALRFLESALDFILCARFHKNKIARYERGGRKQINSSPIRAALAATSPI